MCQNVLLFIWSKTECVRRIFSCGDMCITNLTLDKEPNVFIYGVPFLVIIYTSYKLLKAVQFFAHPVEK